jgi:hypothetical protein
MGEHVDKRSWVLVESLHAVSKCLTIALVLQLAVAPPAASQTNGQLWGTLTWNWLKSDRLTYELELEPKALVVAAEDQPGWGSLDLTPNVEYALRSWLDLVGELATGYTWQTDEVNSFELTPRAGARLHLTSRELPTGPLRREWLPRHRIVVRNLIRVEERNLFYNQDKASESVVRFRNRLEFQIPLNRNSVSDDGARYTLADWEWFIPLGDPAERFASRQRIRAGVGYRRNHQWRFEALYIWSRSRDTTQEDFHTSDHILNLRMKRIF